MIKALIICNPRPGAWLGEYFGDLHPFMVRIANKPLLEYWLEFCAMVGVKEVTLALCRKTESIEEYFQDGARWNLDIRHEIEPDHDDLQAAIMRQRLRQDVSDLLIFNGFFFLNYEKEQDYPALLHDEVNYRVPLEEHTGLFLIRRNGLFMPRNRVEFQTPPAVSLTPLASIGDLFERNMSMVRGDAVHYIMPSYNNEPGVFIGQNVELMKDCEIIPPVIIGSNVQIGGMTRISPNAVIGDNTLIDTGSTVESSVLYGDSYIGSELEFNRKIIYRKKIVDPDSGACLDVVDDFLVSEITERFVYEFVTREIHSLAGLLVAAGMLPLYLLLRPLAGRHDYDYRYCWSDKTSGNTFLTRLYHPRPGNFTQRLFWKFSLDKFKGVLAALRGKILLAGSRPQEATPENLEFVRELPFYRPAVFCYSEMQGHERDEMRRIDEIYYARHRSLSLDLKIVFYTLILRLFRNPN